MIKTLILWFILTVVLSVANAGIVLDGPTIEFAWQKYKARYTKIYDTLTETSRKVAFLESLRYVISRNLEHDLTAASYTAGLNAVSDFTPAEMMCHRTPDRPRHVTDTRTESPYNHTAGTCNCGKSPCKSTIDWVKDGRVFKVGRQECGDCYAWAATYVLGATAAIKNGRAAEELSVQESKDCSYHCKQLMNNGCRGGDSGIVYEGLMKNTKGKSVKAADYPPYNTKNGTLTCTSVDTKPPGALIQSMGRYQSTSSKVNPADECKLIALLQNGPIGADMCVSKAVKLLGKQPESFVYSNTKCTAECQNDMRKNKVPIQSVNHDVMIVGYTADAWIVQNSWGTDWGTNGILKFARGKAGDPKVCNLGYSMAWPIL